MHHALLSELSPQRTLSLPPDGRPIPTELKREEAILRDNMEYDDVEHQGSVLGRLEHKYV